MDLSVFQRGPGLQVPRKQGEFEPQAQTPADYVVSMTSVSMDLITIRALMDFNTFQHIPTTGAIGVQNLAQKCHASPALLTRLLCVLVSSGFIIQNKKGEYSHTNLSVGFKSDEEIARPYACAQLACERYSGLRSYIEPNTDSHRLKKRLNLPSITSLKTYKILVI